MAVVTLKTRFDFDNMSEYKRALSELNSGSRVLASEMKKLKAEYDGNTKSSEYLKKAADILNNNILQQKDKVEMLQAAVKKSINANGEASTETQKWIAKLNNAEAELFKLENAAKKNNEAMSEYNQVLPKINSENEVLASEMRKLQAEYKGNTDSVEYLRKAGELLENELKNNDKEIEVLSKALEESIEKTGEASEETKKLTVELNNAKTKRFETTHAIDENNAAMQGENATMLGMGDTLDSLSGKFGVNIPDGAKKALNGIQGLSTGTVAAMAAAATAVVGLVKGVKELHEMTLQVAADVDEVITESAITGLSEDTIQKLKYAENLVDVSYSTITGSLTKLTKNMASAQDGNEDLSESFASLGVSIEDGTGHLRSSEEVFYDLIDALGAVENDTERDAIAMELLGKSAQDLNPLIKSGSDVLRELGEEAENTGYVLDESQIKKLGEVDDAYQRMQLQIEANRKQLAADFAPAAQKAMEVFTEWTGKAGKALVDSGILKNLASAGESLLDMLDSIGDTIGQIPILKDAFKGLGTVLGGIAQLAAVIADAFDVIAGLFSLRNGGGQRIATALGFNYDIGQASNLQRVRMQQDGTWDMYSEFYAGRNASGNDNWRGGLTYISESGPEMAVLPSGTKIYSAQDTRAVMGGDTFYVTIDAHNVREFMDIVKMAHSARLRGRMA